MWQDLSQKAIPLNAVEIEEAISRLAEQPFDAASFPYAFLEAFGNKETTLKRLRTGASNDTDIAGAVLQRNNIHLAVCEIGKINEILTQLKNSPATSKAKAKFILVTDGVDFEAEDRQTGETIACAYPDFPNHFGFFLPLAGITTVKQIRESAFDMRATSRLNRLYLELLKNNPEWGTATHRHEMNHFMARLIFCFFAENTDIFNGKNLFTATIEQMSAKDAADTHEVISEIFRAMNTKIEQRASENIKRWADGFPYVNGGLFSGSTATPRFTKIARSYLMHIGSLDWTKINPDIFGSMIQAVADEDERGALGMHYTSVPNILKVLNPLFLDDLFAELASAGDNARKLLNLRKRMARIRVFDPACGSGNFLVIAYKKMREIEAIINHRRNEPTLKTEIPLTNFRGIELRDFPAEIARLSLIIAEYQCDVLYRGQKEALIDFLPLDSQNWITCANALRVDWLSVCPPTGTGVKVLGDDLFSAPLDQSEIAFKNEGGETYICGNPPYKGSKWQSEEQKSDLKAVFDNRTKNWKSLDYVAGWFMKAAEYGMHSNAVSAFVSTNSICQGHQVPILWSSIFEMGHKIIFAYASFKWANLASHNAGVTVVIVGISKNPQQTKTLYSVAERTTEQVGLKPDLQHLLGRNSAVDRTSVRQDDAVDLQNNAVIIEQVGLKPDLQHDAVAVGRTSVRQNGVTREADESVLKKEVDNINAYLIASANIMIEPQSSPLNPEQGIMQFGNHPYYGASLIFSTNEAKKMIEKTPQAAKFIRSIYGSKEFITNSPRACMWVSDEDASKALQIEALKEKAEQTAQGRKAAKQDITAQKLIPYSYRFRDTWEAKNHTIIIPGVSSENREYLPCGLLDSKAIVNNTAFALYDAPLWSLGVIVSKLHLVWISSVCVRMRTDFRYSNTLGWNTFPLPKLTENNKADLTRCAENILLARETHFPATIAELYDPDNMPENLRYAHEQNDELLERIYIGRRFKNDTERLEKLFELYTKMTDKHKKQ